MKLKIHVVDVSPRPETTGDICLYVLDNGEYLTLVEAGPSNGLDKLNAWMENEGYSYRDIRYIVLTHIHLDHGGASGYIVENNPDIKIYVHPRGYPHLVNPDKLWKASLDTIGYVAEVYGEPKPVKEDNLVSAVDGEKLDIKVDELLMIYTPGHASHHMSIFLRKEGLLFPGDSLGLYHYNTVIPTTPKPHNVEKSLESISKMKDLQPRKLGFTHFGLADNAIELIEKYEIVYRKWVNLVEKGYREGLDITEIYQKLKEEDMYVNIQEKFFRERGYGEEEVLFSLYGIYSYFEWIEQKAKEGS